MTTLQDCQALDAQDALRSLRDRTQARNLLVPHKGAGAHPDPQPCGTNPLTAARHGVDFWQERYSPSLLSLHIRKTLMVHSCHVNKLQCHWLGT